MRSILTMTAVAACGLVLTGCATMGDGYASADMALWDCGDDGTAAPRLLAHATQVFFFTFLD